MQSTLGSRRSPIECGKYDKLDWVWQSQQALNSTILARAIGEPVEIADASNPNLLPIPMKDLFNHTVFTQKFVRILALIAVLGSLTACGNTTSSTDPAPGSTETDRSAPETTTTAPKTTPDITENQAASDGKPTQTAQAYYLRDTGTNLEPVPVSVSVKANANDADAVLKAAFDRLLSPSSSDPQFVSAIPPNTQLRSLAVKGDGIYVDLSSEFTEGGGSAGIIGRLAQVLYTASSLDSTAAVWILVDGEPLTSMGGEGLEVPQPITRQNFQEQFEL
ncbi:MAG: GerMN domain-containing protein [Geitlerinemataceae cyanobacterium]